MKTTKILYWVFTVLFAAFMIFSATSNVSMHPDAVKLIHDQLGYPVYLIPVLGWAKIIGGIVILIPGFARIKEWAYAGLMFDLLGATYSMAAIGLPVSDWGFMTPFIALGVCSYIFHHKKLKQANAQ